jgi:Lrp/AsnC family transcriptional regulator for asnA, asnC and gidA
MAGLAHLLPEGLEKVEGVRRIQYTLSHNFIKHDYRWCAIVDDGEDTP